MLEGKQQQLRIRIMIVAVTLIGSAVIIRLFSLQILNHAVYANRAEHQYVTPTANIFDRGNIYFTSKDNTTLAAATIANGFKIAIVPNLIKDPERTYKELNNIVPIDKVDFMAKVQKKTDPYEEIAERITEEQATQITPLQLSGVNLYRQKWRFYPGGAMASKTIGFVSYKDDLLTGRYGLEEYYNDVLSRNEKNLYVNFFAQIFANVQSTIFKNTSATGDIVTSIDPAVQAQLENEIASVQDKWSSDTVGGIVLDPYTGEIIAMAQVPTFDLNQYNTVKNVSLYNNAFSQNVYEMGSIVKPLVMSAGLDTGVVTPQTTYSDTGSVRIDGQTLSNFDKRGRGTASMQDVLNQSLNTGMVFVEQRLGKEKFKEYMLNRYKIGEKTGVDLPGEVNGLVSSLKAKNDINYASAAFGQGVATSPLNIVRSFAALANGGYVITPHFATAIIESNGATKTLSYPKSDAILKPETISTIRNMLIKVVDDGYGKGMKNYSVAAKTGTAQIAKQNGQGYYEDRNLHSLIGFFPASKPRYVLYLFNVYPKGALYAIQTLADPFFEMVQFMNNYYDIPPDR